MRFSLDRYSWVCVFVVVIHLVITGWASAIYSVPVGNDFKWHMNLTWAVVDHGLSAFTEEEFVGAGGMPYPPVFHFLFYLPVWVGYQDEIGRILQFVLFPATLGVFILVAHRWRGSEFAMCVAFFLSAAHGFFDRGFQVAPQGLEMLFLGLALYAYMGARYFWALLAISVMIGLHAPVAWFLVLPFLIIDPVFRVRRGFLKRYPEMVFSWSIFMVSVPMVLFLGPYAVSAALKHSAVLSAQKAYFLASPLLFTLVYVGPVFFVGLPFLVRLRWGSMDVLDKLFSLMAVAILGLVPLWPDRVPTYIAVPLAFLIPVALGERRRDFFPLVVAFAGIGVLVKFLMVPVMDV